MITIRSTFLTSRSAVQHHPFEILLLPFSRSGLPFENFFCRSDVITISSKFFASRSALRFHPFQTASWAVSYPFDSRAFHPFNGKPLVYVFAWEVTLIIVFECRSFAADLPLDKLQKFYNNFIMAVSNWTGHERVSFFRHAEYKQTCSRQTTKKERLNALMLLNKNLLWPSQMENVNRNNVKKLKSRWINWQR